MEAFALRRIQKENEIERLKSIDIVPEIGSKLYFNDCSPARTKVFKTVSANELTHSLEEIGYGFHLFFGIKEDWTSDKL
jgi:hypothetical protein